MLTIIGRAAISRIALDEDVGMQYHLCFAIRSRIFDTTCISQVVETFDKFGMASRMKGNAKAVVQVRGETDDQKESPDGRLFGCGPNWRLWMAIADAGPKQQQRQ
jgi:hypothetical protein